MTRKLKILGIAMVALLASAATIAAAAQAAKFTASSYPTTVTATSPLGNGVMKTEAGNIECKEHFEGTLSEASETIDLTPTFSECKAFGLSSTTIHGNGCVLRVHSTGVVDLVCPSGKVLEVTSATCVMHVGSQSGLKWLTMLNNGNHIDIGLELTNLTYNVTKDPFLCPFNGTGHKTGLNWLYNFQQVTTKPVKGGTDFTLTP